MLETNASLLIDGRYRGNHGIARYAREVVTRLQTKLDCATWTRGRVHHLDFLALASAARRTGAAALYSPGFHAAWPVDAPQYLTVHDLIHLDVPSEASTLRRVYYRRLVEPAVKNAELVFTVSEYSKRRIVERLDIAPEHVVVTGNGCSATFLESSEPGPRPTEPYVLCVTNSKAYKNFALMAASARFLAEGVTVRCVGIDATDALTFIADDLRPRFKFESGLTDEQLRALYAGADVLAIPSRMEGFGLPAVEAMAQGTPVVYCAEAVEEVAGPTGLRVDDPDDAKAFADAIDALRAAPLATRRRCMEIAQQHTWDRVAARVLEALSVKGVSPKREAGL